MTVANEDLAFAWSATVTDALVSWVETTLTGREIPAPDERPGQAQRRLVQVMQDTKAGLMDRIVALRGFLRAENIRWRESRQPVGIVWVDADAEMMHRAGFLEEKGRWYANPWCPEWLPDVPDTGVDTAWHPADRRPGETVAGDPMLGIVGLDCYTSKAQRDAVRAVFCAPAGSSLAISLPTGAGKSLCAFLPAVMPQRWESSDLGVTVVVVPTVALQLDLEGRLSELVRHRIAYRPEDKEGTKEIQERCRAGTQGPLLVSPEAIAGQLLAALRVAATAGHLRYLVIDEAHAVLSWGDEFRPAFLQLPGVRDELLVAAQRAGKRAFTTLLLSATFTDYHLRWLRTLFGPEENFRIVHAARLRPEPAYWNACAPDEPTREAQVLEAVHHLPRPAIIYTTRRPVCDRWYKVLWDAGYRRIGRMTGGSNDEERSALLHQWKRDNVDIVVATSAFGLGVDKGDVRTVIHAELPETVDRFYQDVGRSGRDGRESVSLLVTAPGDVPRVAKIGKPKFITAERGWQRWSAMHHSRRQIDESGALLISLTAGPQVDMDGDYNRAWNLRTLQLLARLGAVKFVAHEEANWNQVAVTLGLVPSLDRSYWDGPVAALRQELLRDNEISSRLIESLNRARPEECRAGLLEACYRSNTFDLPVVRACGGCPSCRASGLHEPSCGLMIARHFPREPSPCLTPVEVHERARDSSKWLGSARVGLVMLPDRPLTKEEREEFLLWVAQAGWTVLALPEALRPLASKALAEMRQLAFLVDRPPSSVDLLAHQSLCVWLEGPLPPWWSKAEALLLNTGASFRLILASAETAHPAVPSRRLADLFAGPRLSWSDWSDRFLA